MQKTPTGALFDVKPVDDSGSIDVERVMAVGAVLNLNKKPKKSELKTKLSPKLKGKVSEVSSYIQKPLNTHEEFESLLNESSDLQIELTNFGITTHKSNGRSRPRPILNNKPEILKSKIDSQNYEENLNLRNGATKFAAMCYILINL